MSYLCGPYFTLHRCTTLCGLQISSFFLGLANLRPEHRLQPATQQAVGFAIVEHLPQLSPADVGALLLSLVMLKALPLQLWRMLAARATELLNGSACFCCRAASLWSRTSRWCARRRQGVHLWRRGGSQAHLPGVAAHPGRAYAAGPPGLHPGPGRAGLGVQGLLRPVYRVDCASTTEQQSPAGLCQGPARCR